MSYSPQKKKKEKGDASKISSVFYQMFGETQTQTSGLGLETQTNIGVRSCI